MANLLQSLLDKYKVEDQQATDETATAIANEQSNLLSELEDIKGRNYQLGHDELIGVAPHLRARVQEEFANRARARDESSARQGFLQFENETRSIGLENATQRRSDMEKLLQFGATPISSFGKAPRDTSLRTTIALNPQTHKFEQQPKGGINETQTRVKEIAQHYGVGEDLVNERLSAAAATAAKAQASQASAARAEEGLALKRAAAERSQTLFDQGQETRAAKAAHKTDLARLQYQLDNDKLAIKLDPPTRTHIITNPSLYSEREREIADRSMELANIAIDAKETTTTGSLAEKIYGKRMVQLQKAKLTSPDMVLPSHQQLWQESLSTAQQLKGSLRQFQDEYRQEQARHYGPNGQMEQGMQQAHEQAVADVHRRSPVVSPLTPDEEAEASALDAQEPTVARPATTAPVQRGIGELLGSVPPQEAPNGNAPFEMPITSLARWLQSQHLGTTLPGPQGSGDPYANLTRMKKEPQIDSPLFNYIRSLLANRTQQGR